MKSSRPPLVLMEQMVMVLVFALAAALCLQAFVKSDNMSRSSEQRDRALVQAQSAAEVVRSCKGDMAGAAQLLGSQYPPEEASLMVDYDSDWNLADGTMRYTLGVTVQDSGVDGLGKAQVWVRDEAEGRELLRINVAWQEPLAVEVDNGTAG